MMNRKARISCSFSRAAEAYDEAAQVQAEVAGRLAGRIIAHRLPAAPRALEIGCGTGFLTRALLDRIEGGAWLVTDIAEGMVTRCRRRVPDGRASFRTMDGEAADLPPASADLVVSSLAVQWFADPAAALRRLGDAVAPGGLIAFATLGEGTFAEWRAAHDRAGLVCGTPPYPAVSTVAAWAPPGFAAEVDEESLTSRHPSAHAFLRALKAIGAGTPTPGHRPLAPGALRRVLNQLPGETAMTYHVLYGFFRKEAG